MKKLYGVTVAMTTPFKPDGSLDLAAVEQMTEMLIAKGVHCLYPCGTTGEFLRMTEEERKSVAETVVRTAAGRVVVYIHVGAARQEETVSLARHAEKIGADGIGAVTPQFFKCTDRELEEFYVAVANRVSLPVYLYNIPQNACNDITAATAQRIAERCSNVVGIKYSFQDMKRTLEYLEVRDGTFSVMHGTDRLLAPLLTMGCDGVVSGTASSFPEPYVALWDAYQGGDREGIRKWTQACSGFSTVMKGGASLAHYKAALSTRGVEGGCVRRPLLPLDDAEEATLQDGLQTLCSRYGIRMDAGRAVT
jgi:4-hydroxy-tetrahydrodipicolinate synthase